MKTATRKPQAGKRQARAALRVVQCPPASGDANEFPGQGRRLFQLFRTPLMQRFAMREVRRDG
jgi:hypothetical protein